MKKRLFLYMILLISAMMFLSGAHADDSAWLWFLNGTKAPEETGRGVMLWYIGEHGSSFRQDLLPEEYLPADGKDVGYVIVVQEGNPSLMGFYSNGASGLIRRVDVIAYAAGTGVETGREDVTGGDPPQKTASSAMEIYGTWPADEDVAAAAAKLCAAFPEEAEETSVWRYVIREAEDEEAILKTYTTTEKEALVFLRIEPGIEIQGYDGYEGGTLQIPEEFGGIPVTAIGNSAFRGKSKFDRITVPDTVTRLGENAFEDTYGTVIDLPDNLTVIPYGALRNNLEGLEKLPDGLKAVAYSSLSGSMFLWRPLELPKGLEWIGSCAFLGCSNLPAVILPQSLSHMDFMAFVDCPGTTLQVYRDSYAHRFLEDGGWQEQLEAYAAESGYTPDEVASWYEIPAYEVIDP